MKFLNGVVLYFLIWWVVIFAVLPLGVRPPQEKTPGMMPGAPDKPDLGRKAMITTIISAIIWLAIYLLIKFDVVSFRAMAGGA